VVGTVRPHHGGPGNRRRRAARVLFHPAVPGERGNLTNRPWGRIDRRGVPNPARQGRSEPLAPRIRVAPPASVPPLVRAAPALGVAGRVAQREAEQKPACNGGRQLKL